jgi:dGTP triphosphohydrolase
MRHEEALPATFRQRAAEVGMMGSVGDYLAGMTDRYAFQQYNRLIASNP